MASILGFPDLRAGEGPTNPMWHAGDRGLCEYRRKAPDVDNRGLKGLLGERRLSRKVRAEWEGARKPMWEKPRARQRASRVHTPRGERTRGGLWREDTRPICSKRWCEVR